MLASFSHISQCLSYYAPEAQCPNSTSNSTLKRKPFIIYSPIDFPNLSLLAFSEPCSKRCSEYLYSGQYNASPQAPLCINRAVQSPLRNLLRRNPNHKPVTQHFLTLQFPSLFSQQVAVVPLFPPCAPRRLREAATSSPRHIQIQFLLLLLLHGDYIGTANAEHDSSGSNIHTIWPRRNLPFSDAAAQALDLVNSA